MKLQRKQRTRENAVDFFFANTAHIDVVRNDKLELVYFILLPFTKQLPKDKKKEFHENVDRSNMKSKVQVKKKETCCFKGFLYSADINLFFLWLNRNSHSFEQTKIFLYISFRRI